MLAYEQLFQNVYSINVNEIEPVIWVFNSKTLLYVTKVLLIRSPVKICMCIFENKCGNILLKYAFG